MGTFHMETTKRWEGTEETLGYRIRIPYALDIFIEGSENSFLMEVNLRYCTWAAMFNCTSMGQTI